MDEKTLRTLVETGAIKQMNIIADGSLFHVDAVTTRQGPVTAMTTKGTVKTWSTLDAAAKWLRSLGIGKAQLDVAQWRPGQKELRF